MDNGELTATITRLLRRAPEWVRSDLNSSDPAARIRAEDTLAGMIAAAINPGR